MMDINQAKLKQALAYIDSWLDINFQNLRLPGLQVAIRHKDKLVYSKAFGKASLESQEVAAGLDCLPLDTAIKKGLL